MRAVLTGDWHLESGAHLGHADAELGSSRLRDAHRILIGQIAEEECDVLVFLGDLARTARPGPVAYSIAQLAMRKAKAKKVVLIGGNHDASGEARTCVHVVGSQAANSMVLDKPGVYEVEGIQIGALPWTVPHRLFEQAPNNPRKMHQIVAQKLLDVARGMGAQLDPERPALMVGHWLIAGEKLASGADVMGLREPILNVDDLEGSGPWDAIIFGHNHVHQQVGDHTWSCGPPLRGGFGEEQIETGYMTVEWGEGDPQVKFVETNDRKLLTITLDVPRLITEGVSAIPTTDVKGAVIRLRGACTEQESRRLNADDRRLIKAVISGLISRGASKVIGPQLKIERERRVRSELSAETDPMTALDRYLDTNEVEDALRPEVKKHAQRIMTR